MDDGKRHPVGIDLDRRLDPEIDGSQIAPDNSMLPSLETENVHGLGKLARDTLSAYQWFAIRFQLELAG